MGWGRECACFFVFLFLISPIPFLSFLCFAVVRLGWVWGMAPLRIGIDLNFTCRPTPSLFSCNPKPKMTLRLTRDPFVANSPSHRHSPTRPCTTANSSCSSTPAKRRTHTHTAASNRARRTRTAHRRLQGLTRGATTTTRGSTTTAARRTRVRAGAAKARRERTTPCGVGMRTRTRTRPSRARSMRRAGSCAMRTAARGGRGREIGGGDVARAAARRIAGALMRCCWRLRRTAAAAAAVR